MGERARRTAEQLIDGYGSLAALVQASPVEIAALIGGDMRVAEMLCAARALVRAGLRESVARAPLRAENADLHRYLVARLAGLRHEVLLGFFADQTGGFIAEEVVASGGRFAIECRPRALFARALALDARAVLLVHNHPSGRAEPSAEDLRATAALAKHARALEVELIDHLIVAGPSVFSMRSAGHL